MHRIVFAVLLFPLPAFADCGGETEVFTCQIGDKALEICRQADDLTYAFGPKGAPELTISEPLTTVNFTPWPGVGSAIWESVIFMNEGTEYEVWTSVDRDPGGDQSLQGGINAIKDSTMIAELRCDPGTPSQSLDGIWDLKESVGMCWEFASFSWKTTCEN